MFPHLRSFSRGLGLQLHVVDLYNPLPAGWLGHDTEGGGEEEEEREGEVGEEVTGEIKLEPSATECGGSVIMCGLEMRGVLQLALQEICKCQDMSAGPTFIVGSNIVCDIITFCLFVMLYRHCLDRSMVITLYLNTSLKMSTHYCVGQCLIQQTRNSWCSSGISWTPIHSLPSIHFCSPSRTGETVTQGVISVNPRYVLRYVHVHSHSNEDWMNTHKLLSTTIKRAAKVALGKDAAKVQKYIMSGIVCTPLPCMLPIVDSNALYTASEWEVTVGLFQLKADPNRCCLWSKRTFTDLLEQKPEDPALSLFCDLVAGPRGLQFDSDALKSLNHLKEARMPAKYIGYVI